MRRLCAHAELLVPKHVAITGGPGFVSALIEGLDPPPWVDCGPHRGDALGLIREAVPRIIFDDEAVFGKIADMAAQAGLVVARRLQAPVFALDPFELTEHVIGIRLREAGFAPN